MKANLTPSAPSAGRSRARGLLIAVGAVLVCSATTFVGSSFEPPAGIAAGLGVAGVIAALARLLRRNHSREEAADATETPFRAMVEQFPAIAYTWDTTRPTGQAPAVYISPQLKTILGYEPQDWTEHPELWLEAMHPDDRERVRVASDRADRTGTAFHEEYRIFTKNGRMLWLRDESIAVATNPEGKTLRAQGVMYDITEKKEAEERLQEAENRYRTIVERVPAVAYVWDSTNEPGEAAAAYISPQIESLLGYTPSEWIDDPTLWTDRLHPDDVQGVLSSWDESVRAGTAFCAEYRIRSASGELMWLRDEAVPVADGVSGRPIYQGVMHDITEQRKANERLRTAEERYRTLVENLPVVTYTTALDLASDQEKLSYVAPGVERLTGFTPQEWTSSPGFWESRIHPEDRREVIAVSMKAERTGEPFDAEYRVVRKDGSTLWVHDSAIIAEPAQGTPLWQGVFQDISERKHAEQALADAESRFRTLVEQLPAVVYIDSIDEIATAQYVSPQYERITGYTAEQRLADPELWVRMLHPDDRERVLTESDRTNVTGEAFDIEYRIVRADGDVRWLHDHAFLIEGSEGSMSWQGILSDVTPEKAAEERLRSAEERFRNLVEQMPAITYLDVASDDRDVTVWDTAYISPQVEAILGYTAEAWIEDPQLWLSLLHPDDRERAQEADRTHYEHGAPLDIEVRVITRDGHTRWLRDQAVIIRDQAGKPRYSQGILLDVTERKLAEQQVREAEERYRAIVEHVPAAIYLDLADRSMRTVYISPQIESITGVSPEEWMAEPDLWLDLVQDDREEVERGYLRAITEGLPWQAEYRLRTRDGRTIWVHDETTLLHDENGEPTYVQGVLMDITERKVAEQALRESEQREREAAERLRALDEMKNTFLAAVSHELRSPLTSILGLSITLERAPEMDPIDRIDLLERVSANARKLDRLLKDLLDIDRLNRGIVEPQYRVADIGAVTRRAIESLEVLADRRVEISADPLVLRIDPPKIERIVENLVINAVRHTPADSTIWVSVRSTGMGALLSVEDDGEGVPPELRQVIFEPFRQGPSVPSHSPGTGIGLSLVSRFAELHGGRAWVEDRPGGGAAFKVMLPAGPDEQASRSRGSGSAADAEPAAQGAATGS